MHMSYLNAADIDLNVKQTLGCPFERSAINEVVA